MSPASPGTQPGNRPNRPPPPAALPGERRARADGARGSRSGTAASRRPLAASRTFPSSSLGAGPKRRPSGAPPTLPLRRGRRRPLHAGPNGGLTAASAPPPPPLPLRRLLLPLCGAAPGSARRARGGAGRADNVCRARGSARRGLQQQREPLPLPRSGAAFPLLSRSPSSPPAAFVSPPRFVRPGAVPFPWGTESQWPRGG